MRVLIAGCGYVGTALGLELARKGGEVWGLRRRAEGLPEPIRPISADLLAPDLGLRLPRIDRVDRVVYAASADASTPDGYRDAYVRGVENLLAALEGTAFDRFVFVSSTAVYGDEDGGWVDEGTPPAPVDFRGRFVLEGERRAREAAGGVVLRLGGIYGPGRTRLLDRVRAGEVRCPEGGPLWSNRIHRDDAAGALAHLLALDDPAAVYNGVDEEPAPICEVYRYLAELLDAPEPGPGPTSRTRSNKRVSSRALLEAGYRFRFGDFREGYRAVVEATG